MPGGIYTWDLTRPALSEAPASDAGPGNLFIVDKTTLSTILTTLIPFGTATTGWKQVQINNDVWLATNATYTGTVWNRDDISVNSFAFKFDIVNNVISIQYAAAAANPITWTTLYTFTSTGDLSFTDLIVTGKAKAGGSTVLGDLPQFYVGAGPPAAATLTAGTYKRGDEYLDTNTNLPYRCITTGSESTSVWRSAMVLSDIPAVLLLTRPSSIPFR